ncbi:Transcription factor GTE5 [Cardamine amara subsp. amara]|uniref:Transcription factor GTE5 n=1 Tax=Cardamine amara subsp. amara TaxID=228776 RepID=A0ABD1C3Q5_CARAN
MSSDHVSGGGASKTKHKWSASQNRSKPMVVSRQERSVPLVSPSNSFASEDDHHMLKVSLSSISKLEVRNLKRKLKSELDEVRSLIKRFDPQGNMVGNFGSMAKTGVIGKNKKLKTGNGGKKGGLGADKVDAKGLGLHDYHTIVKEPMDLGTVKTKLGKSLYKSPLDFAEDVRLTFNNAVLYNPIDHEVHGMAKFLLNMFEEKWVSIEMQYDNLHRKLKPTRDIEFPGPVSTVAPILEPLPAPTPSPSPPPPPPPPVLENRTWEREESMTTPVEPETVAPAPEKPEEEEEVPVNNRDLTLDEKRRLSEELQDLPYDKLETVVQIIKKSNPELSQQDDEIELDIDSLDINTLWELYRFVTGYKESLSKKKEDQGLGSERDAESVHNIIQEPTTLVTGTETWRGTESGKAIRTSSPVRQENNASGSSSSNSSSSDSGSGSSDSDSDSSSGRGSDNGN